MNKDIVAEIVEMLNSFMGMSDDADPSIKKYWAERILESIEDNIKEWQEVMKNFKIMESIDKRVKEVLHTVENQYKSMNANLERRQKNIFAILTDLTMLSPYVLEPNPTIRRYALFGYDDYYPSGGMNDLRGFYDNFSQIEYAIETRDSVCQYYQIVRTSDWKNLSEGAWDYDEKKVSWENLDEII